MDVGRVREVVITPEQAPPPLTRIPSRRLTRRLFLALFGVVAAIALVDWQWQASALVGPEGLTPADAFLADLDARLTDAHRLATVPEGSGWVGTVWTELENVAIRLSWVPTLAWFLPAPWASTILVVMGLLGCAGLVAGRHTTPAALLVWASYLSLVSIGQRWLAYQWDVLLVEVAFAAALLGWWGRRARRQAPAPSWWLLRWILFRLVFFGGLVKLTSGDPSWWDGSAMTYHYATQPLPNPMSAWFHHLPGWWHAVETGATLAIELLFAWGLVVFGRPGRTLAAVAITLLMGMLMVSGNYGWFQLLALVLVVGVLDDDHLPRPLRDLGANTPYPKARADTLWNRGLVAAALFGVSVAQIPPRYFGAEAPEATRIVTEAVAPWRTVNTYGLFATMTKMRPIPVLEARWPETEWTELTWRYQTSDPGRTPPQVAPWMPRLDWTLWFAGLSGCTRDPWMSSLGAHLVRGDEVVGDLVDDLRLAAAPPEDVRYRLYLYDLQPDGTWTREPASGPCRPPPAPPEAP